MHRQLETYLGAVARQLEPLPPAHREEELREIQVHLVTAITLNRERGQTDEEAVQNAIEQFGAAEALGEELVQTWRRGETQRRRSFWRAAVSTPIILSGLLYLLGSGILNLLCLSFNTFFTHHPTLGLAFVHGSFFAIFGLTGAMVGAAFPRQAVRGVCLGLAVYYFCWFANMGGRPFPTELRQFLVYFEDIAWASATILSAWAVSRWRGRHTRNPSGSPRLATSPFRGG